MDLAILIIITLVLHYGKIQLTDYAVLATYEKEEKKIINVKPNITLRVVA